MLCVIAKIDPKSKARFLKLQGKIEKLGISVKALHGHITLVSYIGEDEAAFIASCKEILSSCKVFPVCYDKIEVLASSCIVVASPRKEGVLEAVQRKIAEKWAKDLPDYMQADVWYPHTTLLQDMQADLGKIAQHLEENFEPFCGEVQTIEFSRVEKVGYTIVDGRWRGKTCTCFRIGIFFRIHKFNQTAVFPCLEGNTAVFYCLFLHTYFPIGWVAT